MEFGSGVEAKQRLKRRINKKRMTDYNKLCTNML